MPSSTAWVTAIVPRRLTASTKSHSASSVLTKKAKRSVPALLTSTSIGPSSLSVAATASDADAASATSIRSARPSISPATTRRTVEIDVGDRHARALGRQPRAPSPRRSPSAAGDERDPSLQPHGRAAYSLRRHAGSGHGHRRVGALGFGLALRLAAAGVPDRDRLARRRVAPEEAAARVKRAGAGGRRPRARERPGGRGERGRVPARPVPQPVRDAHEPQERTCAKASSWSTPPSRSPPPSPARRPARSASGRARPRSRRRRWCRTASASSRRCTPSTLPRSRTSTRRSTRTSCLRRQEGRQARGGGAHRADPGPALRRRRAAREGADHRVAHRAADRRQRPLQDARGHPPHRAARRAVADR